MGLSSFVGGSPIPGDFELKNKSATIIFSLGILFILFAIFGRYLVLPGYLAGLDQGTGTLQGASQAVSIWKVVRYLLWAYSFKLGIYFIILGSLQNTGMFSIRRWLIAAGGFVYIGFAYIPLPEPSSIIFGIAGGIMTLLMVFIFLRWTVERDQLDDRHRRASDYRMVGYFFFGMATYTLCPLLGVKTYVLSPEKMVQYGLQAEAASFAFHLLIELALGWLFTALSFRQLTRAKRLT